MKLETRLYEEINLVARDVSLMYGKDVECGGFLIGSKKSICSTYIPPIEQQRITVSSANLSKFFRKAYMEAYLSGSELVGIWHSHGSIPTYHSEADYATLRNFLGQIQIIQKMLQNWKVKVVNEKEIEIYNNYKGYRLMFDTSVDSIVEKIDNIKENISDCFYSIIINKDSYSRDYFKALNNKKYDALVARLKDGELVIKKERIKLVRPKVSNYFRTRNGVRVSQFSSFKAFWAYVAPRLVKTESNKIVFDKLEINFKDCDVKSISSKIVAVKKMSNERLEEVLNEKDDVETESPLTQFIVYGDTENAAAA